MLQGVSGDKNYVFYPTGWVLDEARAEWNAITMVFGEEATCTVVLCDFQVKGELHSQNKLDLNKRPYSYSHVPK